MPIFIFKIKILDNEVSAISFNLATKYESIKGSIKISNTKAIVRKLVCILSLVFSIILCSCHTQKYTIILNQDESNSTNKVYDIQYFQNDKINIVVYEYLNGKWNKIISEFLEEGTQKVVLTLVSPTSLEDNYYFQISYQNNLDDNIKELTQIAVKENNTFFHEKYISHIEKNEELQNLAIYEWIDDGGTCVYDLKNFSIDAPYNAKRAYLIMIGSYH